MRRWSLGLTALSLLAFVAVTGGTAAIERSIPACEELLTLDQAAGAMGEKLARFLNRAVTYSSTRRCDYFGGSQGSSTSHALGVEWGPYSDYRKNTKPFARKFICPVNEAACRKLIATARIKSNLESFLAVRRALSVLGTARALPASAFDGNPSLVLTPDRAFGALSDGAYVLVYDRKSAHLLYVICDDTSDASDIKPDSACAIAAAKTAYDNIT